MKKKLSEFIKEQEEKKDYSKKEIQDLLTWISFFQHERFIHLIVTFFTGIGTILFLLGALVLENIPLLILFLITFCLFVPYIFHYYFLENGVQSLYNIYENAKKKSK